MSYLPHSKQWTAPYVGSIALNHRGNFLAYRSSDHKDQLPGLFFRTQHLEVAPVVYFNFVFETKARQRDIHCSLLEASQHRRGPRLDEGRVESH